MFEIIKGHIIYTRNKEAFEVHENSYLVYENGVIEGVYSVLPQKWQSIDVMNYGDCIIIPSFIDLHIHAPQYMQIGLGLNLELIEWLDQYTFKIEGRFEDVNYAKKVYPHFVNDLYKQGTLRSCIFATIHEESTKFLVEALNHKGLSAYVGLVNMNQNAPNYLLRTSEQSLKSTKSFVETFGGSDRVKPIITPRFAPSCSTDLLRGLGILSKAYNLPVQTHLAENQAEIVWVKELFPESDNYSDVYVKAGLYGLSKTLMAHSIFLSDAEIELGKNKNVYLVHCPNSNLNLSSGLMPLTEYLDMGLQVGLGSDVGAGHEIGMNRTISTAIQCSKVRHMIHSDERILKESEAFYLATKMNGKFFGETGSFEKGFKMDALVIRDADPLMTTLTPLEQLQRFIYCGKPENIIGRYLEGELI